MSDLASGGGPQAVHSAAFYGSTAEFLTCVRAFVDQGLGGAEPVLVAVPDPSIGVLREHLDGHVDRVSWADMTRIGGNPARIIPAIRAFAGTYPGHRVRCIAQPLWEARTAAQRRETVRHEALINLAFTDIPVSILCPYDVTRADGSIAASASLTHPMLIRDGTAQPSPGYDATAPLLAECDGPLDAVLGHAAVLAYRTTCAGFGRSSPSTPAAPEPPRAGSVTWSSRSASLPPTPTATPAAAALCPSGPPAMS